jgi:NAD(P)H-nitrite reductase large subunit
MSYVLHTLQQTIYTIFHLFTGNYFQHPIQTSVLETRSMTNIIILGASYSGVSIAHRILKKAAKKGPVKVTLVSPNSHFYWNIASVRGVIPGQLTDEELFQPIAAGFKQYPASQFEFVLAKAQSLDIEAKKVAIYGTNGEATLEYDILVLATGTHVAGDLPFKGLSSTEETKKALHDLQLQVKNAKTIVIAGAGATGVEIAGELGFEYGIQKHIILVLHLLYCNSLLRLLTLPRLPADQEFSREAQILFRRSR